MNNENEIYDKINIKIKDIFTKLRECINEREKILLEYLDKIKNKKTQIEFLEKNINEINKIKEEFNKNTFGLDGNFLEKNDKNFLGVIEDLNNCKNEISNISIDFIYKEDIFNDILNKISNLGSIEKNNELINFNWKIGKNYTLSENKKIATKTTGGNFYNCNILGDIILPKNLVSKWKIKLNKFAMSSCHPWIILIGVGPSNLNQNETNLYEKTWTFICGLSAISVKSGSLTNAYKEHFGKKLKQGDVIEVMINRKNGELSFSINGNYYRVACKIPMDIDLSPFVLIRDQGESIELINK